MSQIPLADPVPVGVRWRAFVPADPLAAAGAFVIIGLIMLAILGPVAAPYPEQGTGTANVHEAMRPPGPGHLLGTDQLGRDVLSRIVVGTRSAIGVSFAVVGLAIAIGVPLGAIAGYRRGRIDAVIMRATDLALAFPSLLLAMAIVAALGPGLEHAALALAISWWPWYTRLSRATAASLRERPFIEAARAIGVSDLRIIFGHIIPNSLSPIIVQATIDIGTVILAAGSLAFIGLGARAPQADWGLMVSEGRTVILDQWWIPTFPGLAIFVAVLAFNLVGDGLRDRFDPRHQR
jgi:peptide/nickel transport system permease protein